MRRRRDVERVVIGVAGVRLTAVREAVRAERPQHGRDAAGVVAVRK